MSKAGKRRCCECGRLRDMHGRVARHEDGTADECCKACWVALDMDEFIVHGR